jgi:putative glutathione S-transferase
MGLLVDGVWTDQWYDTSSTGGRFERSRAAFRNWITADGSPGPSGVRGFAAEAGRYHLYVGPPEKHQIVCTAVDLGGFCR